MHIHYRNYFSYILSTTFQSHELYRVFHLVTDLRFLHRIGADAVGMSTVPEVITAHHGKLRVLGLSGISNKANLDGSTVTTHEEVLEAGRVIVPKLKSILLGFLRRI